MNLTKKLLAIASLSLICLSASGAVTLDSCRHMALRNNKNLAQSALKIEKAGYQRKQAHAAYLPTFDLVGTYMHNGRDISLVDINDITPSRFYNPSTGNYDFVIAPDLGVGISVDGRIVNGFTQKIKDALTFDTKNVCAAALMLKQPIYMGGKITALNHIAKYNEELQGYMHDTQVAQVIYDVDAAYWLVVSLKAKQRLAMSYLDLIKRLDHDVAVMLEQGVATRAVLLNVDVRVNEASVAVTKVDNGLSLARMALAQLCGLPLDAEMTLADENNDALHPDRMPPTVDMGEVMEKRSELRSLDLATKIFDEKAKVERSEMLPTVAAVGAVHTTNPNVYNGVKNRFGWNYSIGAIVKIPIWHWGGLTNKYKAAQAEAKIKRLELADAREKVELQVRQASFKCQEARKTLDMTQSNLVKANENLRVANLGFKEGVMTADDVMKAQTAWLQANSENIDAQINVRLTDVYLQKATGNLHE